MRGLMRYSTPIVAALTSFAGCANGGADTRQTSHDMAIKTDTAASGMTAYVFAKMSRLLHYIIVRGSFNK